MFLFYNKNYSFIINYKIIILRVIYFFNFIIILFLNIIIFNLIKYIFNTLFIYLFSNNYILIKININKIVNTLKNIIIDLRAFLGFEILGRPTNHLKVKVTFLKYFINVFIKIVLLYL